MSSPKVSVCIPAFRAASTIEAAMKSVLEQTMTDFELIVIDNRSDDGTFDVAKRVAEGDPRVRVLQNDTNIGAEGNWNRCLAEARGQYIKLLPADDLLHPTSLARQSAVLEDPANEGISIVSADRDILDDSGKRFMRGRGMGKREARIEGAQAIARAVRSGGNPLGEPHAVLFRSSSARQIGNFDGSAGYLIDLDYWCRLLKVGDLYAIPECLSSFRVSAGSWSIAVAKRQALETRAFYRKLREKGWITASDQAIGDVMAHVMAGLRRAVYVYLGWRK